jgi:hypothetical protein
MCNAGISSQGEASKTRNAEMDEQDQGVALLPWASTTLVASSTTVGLETGRELI